MSNARLLKNIVSAIETIYPKALAESAWDNTGLLLDCPSPEPLSKSKPTVLLTIDLTTRVVDEILHYNASHASNRITCVVAYHPFIFRGIKAVTSDNPQHVSMVKLIREGVSVYSPHTAVDAAPGGVNDWLCDVLSGGKDCEESRSVISKSDNPPAGFESAGVGRVVKLKTPVSFTEAVSRIKSGLKMDGLQAARAARHRDDPTAASISSFAVCAGSGGSVFNSLREKPDLYFSGELSHHELLALTESGSSAVLCGHSNTERGYLQDMREKLQALVQPDVDVIVSETDSDPLEIL